MGTTGDDDANIVSSSQKVIQNDDAAGGVPHALSDDAVKYFHFFARSELG